jgi:hypothetical protein
VKGWFDAAATLPNDAGRVGTVDNGTGLRSRLGPAHRRYAQRTGGGSGERVDIDNFVRAATDLEFGKYVAMAGGVNRLFHFREPIPIDNQPTIRMNRDTLYSAVVVDISEGATLTLSEVGERYMSAMAERFFVIHMAMAGAGSPGHFPLAGLTDREPGPVSRE